MSISNQTMNTMVYEILNEANNLLTTDRQRAISFLQNNRSRVVVEGYLKMNYDPSVVFQLPPGQAPYKRRDDVPDGYCLTDLKQEFRRMRVFTDGQLNLTRIRREQLWLQMCEGLYWKEADLINKIKDRRITDLYSNLTADVVREAFPTLLPVVVADPIPVEAIAPIDFGEDPSVVSEAELIQSAIAKFLQEEEEAKKSVAVVVTTATTANRKKPGPKPKPKPVVVTTEPTIRKKPGPKPKPKPVVDTAIPTVRKKPGPKPKLKS